MFVRTMYVTGDPAEIEGAITRLRDEGPRLLGEQSGYRGFGLFVDREQGKISTGTWWESEQAERDSDAAVGDRRAEMIAPFARTVTFNRWEPAVVTSPRPELDGGGFRLHQLTIDPAQMDRAAQAFQSEAVPKLQAIDGFAGAAMLLNRAAGRASVGMLYRDKAALVASRGPQARARGQVMGKMGAEIQSIEEFEVILVR